MTSGSMPDGAVPGGDAAMPAERLDALLEGALPAGSLFAVGGRVRDEIRTALDGRPRPAKDLDYVVTGVALDELVRRLEALGRTDVVGASFAVVKLTVDGRTVDVALPRRERSTGAGHRDFQVEFGAEVPLEDDLARRDFRMNMIARALPGGEIVDPYGGEADIRASRIDLLRPEAFEEDPLRMLRAAQFAARFGFTVSPQTMAAMRAAAPLVRTVSGERIHDELVKLLEAAETPSIGIELLRAGGVLPFILPEVAEGIGVEQNVYHAYDVYRHGLATLDATPPGDLVLRLAALFHDVGKPQTRTVEPEGTHFYGHENVGEAMAREALGRLRFSSEHTDDVARLVRNHMYANNPEQTPAAIRRFIRRVGVDLVPRQFALRHADIVGSGLPKRNDDNERFEARVYAELARKPPLSVKDLAIGGRDVVAIIAQLEASGRGPFPKAKIGGALAHVLERLLDDPSLNRDEQRKEAEAWLRRTEP
jgi:poly(A) polymerase/tRNA nucleotidyltransferase (CCA-adding enzyme)